MPKGSRLPCRRSPPSAARERQGKAIDFGVLGSLLRSPVSLLPVPASRGSLARSLAFFLRSLCLPDRLALTAKPNDRACARSDRQQKCNAGRNPCAPRELCRRRGLHTLTLGLALQPFSLRWIPPSSCVRHRALCAQPRVRGARAWPPQRLRSRPAPLADPSPAAPSRPEKTLRCIRRYDRRSPRVSPKAVPRPRQVVFRPAAEARVSVVQMPAARIGLNPRAGFQERSVCVDDVSSARPARQQRLMRHTHDGDALQRSRR